jgi:FkbM family methyltransferase
MHDQIKAILEGREFQPNLPPFSMKQFRNGVFIHYYYDLYVSSSLLCYGEWAQFEVDFLSQFIGPGDTVVDVGAFIGTHTIPFAREVGITGEVFAFEPTKESFYCLSGNIVINNVYKVKAFNIALSSKKQKLEFPEMDVTKINNFGSLGNLETSDNLIDTGASRKIDAVTLDSFKLKACKLLKIDAENMEIEVLKGAAKTIKKFSPIIYAETPPANFDLKKKVYKNFDKETLDVVAFLREFDYVAYYFISPMYNPDNYFLNKSNIFGNTASIAVCAMPKTYGKSFHPGNNYLQQID